MNVAKAIELAFAQVMRKYCTLGDGTVIRAWQSLNADGSFDPKKDRQFPCIDIRCGPPETDEVQATLQSDCTMMIFTKVDDDQLHSVHSDIQSEIERVLSAMFSQFRKRTLTSPEIADFIASLNSNLPAASFGFDALAWVKGERPFDESGLNAGSYGMAVKWNNPEFRY